MLGIRSPNSYYSSGYESDASSERNVSDPGLFSLRVFVGGFAKGTSESLIRANFSQYIIQRVDWPHKDAHNKHNNATPNGFVFLEFLRESDVVEFLADCMTINGRLYTVFMTNLQNKCFVEVKPFHLADARFGRACNNHDLSHRRVFVGGIPRDTTAREIHDSMTVFGSVSEVVIDLLPATKYPRGTAYVVFNTVESRNNAVRHRVLTLKNSATGTGRIIEIKPFLMTEHRCDVCKRITSPVSCYNKHCMKITCLTCYDIVHQYLPVDDHRRIYRGSFYTPFDARNRRF